MRVEKLSDIDQALQQLEDAIKAKEKEHEAVLAQGADLIEQGRERFKAVLVGFVEEAKEKPWMFLGKVALSSFSVGMMLGSRFKHESSGE
jgi:hypothetical protein